MTALPEPSRATPTPTQVFETASLAPTPFPTRLPGEYARHTTNHCVLITLCGEGWLVKRLGIKITQSMSSVTSVQASLAQLILTKKL